MMTITVGRRPKTRIIALVSSVAAGVLVATALSGPAMAADSSDVQGVSDLVAAVAPSAGSVIALRADQEGQLTAGGHAIPRSSDDPVTVAGGSGDPLQVTLPSTTSTWGSLAADGTVVYSAADRGADIAVQALDTGKLRMQTIISSAAEPHDFSYGIGGGYQPIEGSDGQFWAYKFDQTGALQLYGIAPAWAKDATGASVDTHYEIRGNSLVQVVTPNAKTVYPVVADPTWEWYNAAYGAGFSKRETRDLAASGTLAAFCALLPPPLSVECGIFYGSWIWQANLAKNANGCVFIAVVPAPIAMRWLSNKCK